MKKEEKLSQFASIEEDRERTRKNVKQKSVFYLTSLQPSGSALSKLQILWHSFGCCKYIYSRGSGGGGSKARGKRKTKVSCLNCKVNR